MDEKINFTPLANLLREFSTGGRNQPPYMAADTSLVVARSMHENPAPILDALVETGGLRKVLMDRSGWTCTAPGQWEHYGYSVAPPHKHKWDRVSRNLGDTVMLGCACGEDSEPVPNKVPLEVPHG